MRYYSLQEVRPVEPGRVQTAAIIMCVICRRILAGMGGPGRCICEECLKSERADGWFM